MKAENLLIYQSKQTLIRQAAYLIAGAIRETLQLSSTCRIGLAGGSTPEPVYRLLCDETLVGALPFEKIELLFGDERCVSPDDSDSNFRMAKRAFGKHFSQFKKVERIQGELDRLTAATNYESALERPIDVLLLGMGPDAHIASLFPGSVAFAHTSALAMAVQCPKPPPWRITITPKVIEQAKQVFVLAAGKEKAAALEAVFSKPIHPAQYPAQLVHRATWMVDAAAAVQLNFK